MMHLCVVSDRDLVAVAGDLHVGWVLCVRLMWWSDQGCVG